MDKSRQQFEEWFAPRKEEMKRNGLGMISITRMHQHQWMAWQASRDSLLLNLPEREKSNNGLDRFSIAYNEGIAACEQYLLDMGVKINNEFDREKMKLGVLYARNHLISAYRANFIECDESQFAMFMNTLTHVANESIDIELMMSDVLACNNEAESWIKETLIKHAR